MRPHHTLSLIIAGCLAAGSANAFERVKLSDGELSCEQLYAEVDYMGSLVGDAEGSRDTANAIATGSDMTNQGLGLAATAAAWSGAGSSIGSLAQIGSLTNMFGGAAKTYSGHQGRQAEIDIEDARARKTHLTELFIKKECKVSALDQDKLSAAKQQFAVAEQAVAPKEEKSSGFPSLW